MSNSPIGRLRVVGIVEGLSFLILLGIAMPLKHLWGYPIAVKIVGWIHGLLFIAFCVAWVQAKEASRWDVRRAGPVLLAALVPFGPFLIDARLRREEVLMRRRATW
jgi:integral membrane protein